MNTIEFSGSVKEAPCRHTHHSDFHITEEDKMVGDALAYIMGDTFINFQHKSPVWQWSVIAKALRIHGVKLEVKESAP